jgi:putative ATP-binding cassette transporter
MFLSQTPFLPDGTLRNAVTYGMNVQPTDADLAAALQRVGLQQLVPALDHAQSWQRELGIAERMRLSLARVLLRKPKWLVADEAINLADDGDRKLVESIFAKELAGTGVLGISGSPARDGFYSRTAALVPHPVQSRSGPESPATGVLAQAAV